MKSRVPTLLGASPSASLIDGETRDPDGQLQALVRARAFAEPLIASETLDTGENTLAHADAVAAILKTIGGSEAMQAASYLVYACDHLNKPQDVIAKAFGDNFAALAMETTKLVRVQRQARTLQSAVNRSATPIPMAQTAAAQTENVRKMLLAFSRDLRVVMLRLASRLQTLRHFAATKLPVPPSLARESLQVFAPLANRLGIWEIKWELEDLSFRFLEPDTYRQVARLLDEKRAGREAYVQQLRVRLEVELKAEGIASTVQGRPKAPMAPPGGSDPRSGGAWGRQHLKLRAYARCCWPSRAICAWSCCAWRRACKRCATTQPPKSQCRLGWPAKRCRCSRHWPTGWVFGKSSGRSKTCRSVFWSPTPTDRSPSCWTKNAWSAKPMSKNCASSWPKI